MHALHRWLGWAFPSSRRAPLLQPAKLAILAGLFLATLLPAHFPAQAATPAHVTLLRLDDTIQPVSQSYLLRGLKAAADAHSDLVLIELNTPGGLLTSTRTMVEAILDSPIPVVVYVAPAGSRAGSAGFFLLEAADIAAMAPGTNAGAAHPVDGAGKNLDSTMKEKVENDTTAFLRSYTAPRGRNVDAAQAAVLQSKSYTADEALKLKLIDVIAPNEPALLKTLSGIAIHRFHGATVHLDTANAIITAIEPTPRERILGWLVDPDIALLCIVLGALLIYLEFNIPGTIIPGALGTLLLLTALFALNLLPLQLTSVMLILASGALLLLELKAPSHGVLATAGILCFVLGSLTLVNGPIPEQRVHIATAAGSGVGFGIITFFLVRIALRARRNKIITGPAAMVGALAIVQGEFNPQGGTTPRGQVLVRGEIWFAELTTRGNAPAGSRVRVAAVRGLTLLVEQVPNSTHDA